MNRRFSGILAASLMILTIAGCGGNNQAQPPDAANDGNQAEAPVEAKQRIIRAGIGLNDQHPQYKGLLRFKEIVEAESNGAIKVETYHSGQLGDDRTMMEALQLGTQEMTIPSTAPIGNFVTDFTVFDIPFLMPSEEVADKVLLESEIAQQLLDKLPAQNLIGLTYWENGFRNLTNNVRAVGTASDFKGLKIRTMENQLHLAAFKALGANPTPMAFSELFTALQQGTVDGQENPIATIYLQKFYEVQKHISLTKHVYSPFVVMLSKKFWDDSTPEQQELLKRAALEAGTLERQLNREANEQYLTELKAEGMTVTEISPEARAELESIIVPIVDQFADNIGKDTVEKVRAAITEASQ
ncbi:TRAP transporter substrate-binding protein [Paenibacillus tarimensis]|uniref:TRAP transporter substrate-binding protein n=1 Tax=Paenibacillus tarimensis TaxID=416012 RepID=UPI001F1E99C1|nr:TRAP transporter substrate-binding protein [Paenibacillus tarimensis]MCF2944494.1 TRAP transporter substrate-binding protein [Paenibacillus tarimensis]